MRPRERYACYGADEFGDDELLALVIGTGDARRTSTELARDVLQRFDGLPGLANVPTEALRAVPGIGLARAVRVHAALQLGRRAVQKSTRVDVIRRPEDAWNLLRARLELLDVEELHAIFLDRRNRVLAARCLTRGSDANTIVDPRQVFRPAVQCGAASVLVAHNHPSGDPTPSEPDRAVTERLHEAGRIVGVSLLDHLVIGRERYVSLAEEGCLPQWPSDSRRLTADR